MIVSPDLMPFICAYGRLDPASTSIGVLHLGARVALICIEIVRCALPLILIAIRPSTHIKGRVKLPLWIVARGAWEGKLRGLRHSHVGHIRNESCSGCRWPCEMPGNVLTNVVEVIASRAVAKKIL